jgi:hypothetical protein
MSIEVGRLDLDVLVIDFAQDALVAHPLGVLVEQAADFVKHVKSPRRMSGGTVTFTNCMNSNSSSQGSPASENRSAGSGIAQRSL